MQESILKLPFLPLELVTEILFRLLVKPLLNTNKIMKVVLLDLLNNDSNMEAFDLNYLMTNAYNNVWVLGSVNGLICLAIEFTNLFIWNLSIRKFKTSLESRSRDKPFCFKYGFGCDDSLDDYKVVDMFCYKYGSSHHVEMVKIYSLKSDY
ncbi:hypothetical protein P3S67_022608 [Capsicum chacoense]